jgi:hypothetical protein
MSSEMQEPVQEPVQEPIQEPVEFQQLENQSLYDRMSVIEEKITELNENNATFSSMLSMFGLLNVDESDIMSKVLLVENQQIIFKKEAKTIYCCFPISNTNDVFVFNLYEATDMLGNKILMMYVISSEEQLKNSVQQYLAGFLEDHSEWFVRKRYTESNNTMDRYIFLIHDFTLSESKQKVAVANSISALCDLMSRISMDYQNGFDNTVYVPDIVIDTESPEPIPEPISKHVRPIQQQVKKQVIAPKNNRSSTPAPPLATTYEDSDEDQSDEVPSDKRKKLLYEVEHNYKSFTRSELMKILDDNSMSYGRNYTKQRLSHNIIKNKEQVIIF